jgi:hypothetical protein
MVNKNRRGAGQLLMDQEWLTGVSWCVFVYHRRVQTLEFGFPQLT